LVKPASPNFAAAEAAALGQSLIPVNIAEAAGRNALAAALV
jgi:hypothetical protein